MSDSFSFSVALRDKIADCTLYLQLIQRFLATFYVQIETFRAGGMSRNDRAPGMMKQPHKSCARSAASRTGPVVAVLLAFRVQPVSHLSLVVIVGRSLLSAFVVEQDILAVAQFTHEYLQCVPG